MFLTDVCDRVEPIEPAFRIPHETVGPLRILRGSERDRKEARASELTGAPRWMGGGGGQGA